MEFHFVCSFSCGVCILVACLCVVQAPGGVELSADYWELVGSSPPGGAENLVNEESLVDVQLDQRHMMLRGDRVRAGQGAGQEVGTGWGRGWEWLC